MTDTRRGDLFYGHLGDTVYDSENREWYFTRSPGITRCLEPLGQFSTTLQSPLLLPPLSDLRSAADHQKNIKGLADSLPELAPSVHLLPSLTQASENIIVNTSTHDPVISELFTLGKAADIENQRSGARTVDIAAVAGGPSGGAVRLVRLTKERPRWEGYTTVHLASQTLAGGDQGWWVGGGGQILQLRFSENWGAPSTWLAVRQSTTITILRPLLRRTPVAAHIAGRDDRLTGKYPPSRLDANPMLDLHMSVTGGEPYADVTFNPFYERQFGVIDREGRWWIQNIEGQRRRRNTWSVIPGPNGDLRKSDVEPTATWDGWGMILWAGTANTILVANRKILRIYNVKKNPRRLSDPDIGLVGNSDWILDIKRRPSDYSHVFVLTSSSLFWLHFQSDEEDDEHEPERKVGKVLLSWRHSRDHEDISMQILISGPEEERMLLLYSRLTSLITTFTFTISNPTQLPLSVSDPFHVSLGNSNGYQEGESHKTGMLVHKLSISAIMLAPVDHLLPAHIDHQEPGVTHMKSNNTFYKLYLLYNDLSVCERLYVHRRPGRAFKSGSSIQFSRVTTTKSTTKVVEDDFIVPDGMPLDDEEDLSTGLIPDSIPQASRQVYPVTDDPWTVNLEWLHHEIQEHSNARVVDKAQSSESRSFASCVEDMTEKVMKKLHLNHEGIDTLAELLHQDVLAEDVDSASSSLLEFLDRIGTEELEPEESEGTQNGEERRLKIVPLLRPALARIVQGNGMSEVEVLLLPIYENLIEHWISSLPSDVPGRVRVSIENGLRRIATQLCLASYGVQCIRRETITEEPSEPELLAHGEQLDLPVRRKNSATSLSQERKGKSRDSSRNRQILSQGSNNSSTIDPSTPQYKSVFTPDLTPSWQSQSSHSVTSDPTSEDPACQRLRSLARITSQPPLPRSMRNVLSHWAVGANPKDYDWEATQRALAPAPSSDTEGTEDESQAKRRRRRLERQSKRQRQDTVGGSSIPQPKPTRVWGSQRQVSGVAQGSSQSTEAALLPQSQGEPGVFGSRLAMTKKAAKGRKRRAAGF